MSQHSSPKYRGCKRKNDPFVANDHVSMSDASCMTNATGSRSVSNKMFNMNVNDDVGLLRNLKFISE